MVERTNMILTYQVLAENRYHRNMHEIDVQQGGKIDRESRIGSKQ